MSVKGLKHLKQVKINSALSGGGCCSYPTAALKTSRLGAATILHGWEGIPLYDRQWKEGVLVLVLASMYLPESHRAVVSGDPMIGLYVVWDGYSY